MLPDATYTSGKLRRATYHLGVDTTSPVGYTSNMTSLRRTADRKVSPLIRRTPKSFTVKSANSFGLPSGKAFSCPGATSVCESICYAGKLERLYKGVLNILMSNWLLLRDADYNTMVTLLADMINDFRAESDKLGSEKIFRIHWDGDFFSALYAQAWAEVIRANPDITFWVYTRSFTPALNVVPIIAGIDNLTVYLSVDTENVVYAAGIRQSFPTVKVASLAKTASEAKAQVPTSKIVSCPENVGKRLPLIVTNPRGTMGACAACMLCVDGRADVAFATSGKE